MRLSKPKFTFEQALAECRSGITGNAALRIKALAGTPSLIAEGLRYLTAANTGKLHTIEPIDDADDPDPVVVHALTRSELIKVYESYFVPKKKPARRIYDDLLNAAFERCPFCGGIGTPRNLDHFLPKTHFPQFSVLPWNLVPACRDCNMDGKATAFATRAEDQIIQPYADDDRFFEEQWVFATYHDDHGGGPGNFEYFVRPPDEWDEVDKQRVKNHFADFNLARRYAIKAAELLDTVLRQMQRLREAGLNSESIKNALLQPGIDTAQFVNHWQVGMYQALMDFPSHPAPGE